MQRTTIQNAAVGATLQWIRLPLTVLEALAGQRGKDSWPPAVAFEGVEASARQVIGSVLGNEGMVEQGRLQQAKVAELHRAAELDMEAELIQQAADRELQSERGRAEEQRREAEEKARQNHLEVDRKKRAAEQRAERQLDQKRTAIDEAAEKRQERVAATERAARLTRVNEEAAALKQQRRAVTSVKTASAIADALEDKKDERKTR